MTITEAPGSVLDALGVLRDRVGAVRLPLDLPDAPNGRRTAARSPPNSMTTSCLGFARSTPRFSSSSVARRAPASRRWSTPLWAGQSARRACSAPTRAPVLAHHPEDAVWFTGDRILPGLARVTDAELAGPGTLHLVADESVPQGLALLDAPDVDSVVTQNRQLAGQLLAAPISGCLSRRPPGTPTPSRGTCSCRC